MVYSHLGSPHSQCIPIVRALGRIRTSNHQVRSLALWSIELRGRVSCTCEWRMRASNPPVVPGANRVTTPSSPIPQSSASTGRGSRTPTENLHWFLRPARLPIPPYRSVWCCTGMARIELATYRSTSGCSATEPHPQRCQRWGERRSNPRLPGFNRALGPSQLPPHVPVLPINCPADPERRRTESNRPRAGLQPAT